MEKLFIVTLTTIIGEYYDNLYTVIGLFDEDNIQHFLSDEFINSEGFNAYYEIQECKLNKPIKYE